MNPQEREEMRQGVVAITADAEQAELDRELGATMVAMIDAEHGDGAGRRFRDLVVKPTRPGTPERALQNRVWALLTARLNKLAREAK